MIFFRTLNDSQKNDNDEKEEADIEKNPVNFGVIPICWFNDITNSSTSSNTLVQIEHKTLKKILKKNMKIM